MSGWSEGEVSWPPASCALYWFITGDVIVVSTYTLAMSAYSSNIPISHSCPTLVAFVSTWFAKHPLPPLIILCIPLSHPLVADCTQQKDLSQDLELRCTDHNPLTCENSLVYCKKHSYSRQLWQTTSLWPHPLNFYVAATHQADQLSDLDLTLKIDSYSMHSPRKPWLAIQRVIAVWVHVCMA